MFLHLLLFALVALASGITPPQHSCIDITGHITVCPGNTRPSAFNTTQYAAYAKYTNRINETGWAELDLVTNGALEDSVQAYYAGVLEGYLTAWLIGSYRYNVLEEDTKNWCGNLSDFIETNLKFTTAQVQQNPNDRYWKQVGLVQYQLAGLDDGIEMTKLNTSVKIQPHLNVRPCGVLLLNLITELGDIQSALKQKPLQPQTTRCSGLVKLLPDGDVLVSHTTWTDYNSMLRILKRYTLNFASSAAKSIALSSYPGTIFSVDDFYITSTNLVVLETTIANFNRSLWKYVRADSIVFEFIRNTVANRLARSGKEWTEYFSKYNSGTYSNQWIIVNYNRLNHTTGLLTILEQMPGTIESADLTSHLLSTTYWPSYNVPYFPNIYRLSGYGEKAKQFGDFYTYNRTARALIFARDHGKVTDINRLFHLMRYNNFKHDPLSRCNCTPPYTAGYAIAARFDLNDKTGHYPIDSIKFRPHGAIDAKIVSSELAKKLQMVAISGPTDEQVPAFSWATTLVENQLHADQPIEWRFKPVLTVWENSNGGEVFPFYHIEG